MLAIRKLVSLYMHIVTYNCASTTFNLPIHSYLIKIIRLTIEQPLYLFGICVGYQYIQIYSLCKLIQNKTLLLLFVWCQLGTFP